jgi:hypothetical protein
VHNYPAPPGLQEIGIPSRVIADSDSGSISVTDDMGLPVGILPVGIWIVEAYLKKPTAGGWLPRLRGPTTVALCQREAVPARGGVSAVRTGWADNGVWPILIAALPSETTTALRQLLRCVSHCGERSDAAIPRQDRAFPKTTSSDTAPND